MRSQEKYSERLYICSHVTLYKSRGTNSFKVMMVVNTELLSIIST